MVRRSMKGWDSCMLRLKQSFLLDKSEWGWSPSEMRSQGNDADDPKAQIKKFRVHVFFYVPAPLYTSKEMPVFTARAPALDTMSEAAMKSFLVSPYPLPLQYISLDRIFLRQVCPPKMTWGLSNYIWYSKPVRVRLCLLCNTRVICKVILS